MPWDCKTCGTVVEQDDTACPSCQAPKTSWTMVAEHTRTFTMSTRRFTLLRGDGADPIPAATAGLALDVTGSVPALTADDLRALVAAEQRPAASDVLVIRLFPKKHPDLTTVVEVLFETDEVAEHELEVERPDDLQADGHVDVKVVCVAVDPAGLEDPGWADIHVLAVGEETERGHAPFLEVSALKKKNKKLTIGAGDWFLSFDCYDASGFVPAGNLRFSFQGADGQTDAEGHFERAAVGWGEHELVFPGGSVWAPAVHDPRIVCAIRLPFHEVSQEEREAYLGAEWDDPDDGLAAFGAFDEEDDDEPEEDHDVEEDHEEECCAADPEEEPDEDDAGEYLISISCVDASGFVPAAGLSFSFNGETHRLDEDGQASVEDVPWGEHELAFAGGRVWVPAVHDARIVCAIRLPFHEVSQEEREAYLGAEWDDPDDGLDAFQAFEPEDEDDDEDAPEPDHDEEGCGAPEPDDDEEELAELAELLE